MQPGWERRDELCPRCCTQALGAAWERQVTWTTGSCCTRVRRGFGGEGGFGVPLSPMGALIDVSLLQSEKGAFGAWGHTRDT